MNITFREYKDGDRGLLVEFCNKLEEYVKVLDPLKRVQNLPGFTEMSIQETLEQVARYQGKIWIAEDNDKPVGYIIGVIREQSEKNKLEIGPHTLGEVLDIYLEEDYRGQGVGKKMLLMMEEYFRNKGCDSMWIGVFVPNENAHQMYKKYGFIDREIGMLKQL